MKAKALCFGFALILSFLAAFAGGPQPLAEAACPPDFCAKERASCLAGCSCAIFTCDPVGCWSDCSCPIICLD
jgi:hypothetical protein